MKTLSEYRGRLNSLNLPEVFFDEHGNPKQAVLLSYCAGIIDGEGCIRISRNRKERLPNAKCDRFYGCIMVGMTEKKIPELLKVVIGGTSITERVRGENRQKVYRWSCTGKYKVKEILDKIYPYLFLKRKQAELVLELINNWETPYSRRQGVSIHELQRREELYRKVRKLNAVGAAATTERKSIREDEATVCSCGKSQEGTEMIPRQTKLWLVS